MTVRFETDEYRASHGRQPRGWGVWAFYYYRNGVQTEEPTFTPHAMSFVAAKAWIKGQVNQRGDMVYVQVAP